VYVVKGSQPDIELRMPPNYHLDVFGQLCERPNITCVDSLMGEYQGTHEQHVVGYRKQ
jgi:hypothetical protein